MAKDKTEQKRDVLSAYRLWLNSQVANDISPAYTQLLAILWRTEFFAEYENDENRAADGKSLRGEFASGANLDNSEYLKLNSTPVRLLEVMIALAKRISGIVSIDDDIPKYFWEMVASMEMNKLDDSEFNASSAQKKIDILLGHKYRRNGRGGLFFVKGIGPEYNAPLLDIWTQCMAYLNAKGKE